MKMISIIADPRIVNRLLRHLQNERCPARRTTFPLCPMIKTPIDYRDFGGWAKSAIH